MTPDECALHLARIYRHDQELHLSALYRKTNTRNQAELSDSFARFTADASCILRNDGRAGKRSATTFGGTPPHSLNHPALRAAVIGAVKEHVVPAISIAVILPSAAVDKFEAIRSRKSAGGQLALT